MRLSLFFLFSCLLLFMGVSVESYANTIQPRPLVKSQHVVDRHTQPPPKKFEAAMKQLKSYFKEKAASPDSKGDFWKTVLKILKITGIVLLGMIALALAIALIVGVVALALIVVGGIFTGVVLAIYYGFLVPIYLFVLSNFYALSVLSPWVYVTILAAIIVGLLIVKNND